MGRFWFSVKKNYLRALTVSFAVLGAEWTVVEFASHFLSSPSWLRRWPLPALIVVAAAAAGPLAARRPTRVQFELATTDTTVRISFGNLFESPGHRVIAVNEYFDGELGNVVSKSSLHGKLIHEYFDGNSTAFEAAVDADLAGVTSEVTRRAHTRRRAYPIGTTVRIQVAGSPYLLVALTHTDQVTHQSSADVAQLWNALCSVWQAARTRAQGDTISVPLIGSGLGRVGLPPHNLLQLLLLSLVVETKREKVASHIEIVLYMGLYEQIDLGPIRDEWA